jgi:hypothetical protein
MIRYKFGLTVLLITKPQCILFLTSTGPHVAVLVEVDELKLDQLFVDAVILLSEQTAMEINGILNVDTITFQRFFETGNVVFQK